MFFKSFVSSRTPESWKRLWSGENSRSDIWEGGKGEGVVVQASVQRHRLLLTHWLVRLKDRFQRDVVNRLRLPSITWWDLRPAMQQCGGPTATLYTLAAQLPPSAWSYLALMG